MRGTLPPPRDEGNSDGLASVPFLTSGFPKLDLASLISSVGSITQSWDHMVEEAAIGTMVDVTFLSCHEKVASMMEHMATPPPAAMSSCLGNLPPSLDDN
jgi:hypothetical protein